MQERRAPQALTVGGRGIRPQLAGRQGTVTLRAPAAFLWPLRATSAPWRNSTPRPTARGGAVTPAVVRGLPSLRHPHSEAYARSAARAYLRHVAARSLRDPCV